MIKPHDRDYLILNNLELAKKLARSRQRKILNIEYDELESAAFLGLVEAAENYQGVEAEHFPSYAIYRILGAIQDYLRELMWGSKNNRLKKQPLKEYPSQNSDYQDNNEIFDKIISVLPIKNQTVLKKYYIDCDRISEIATVVGVHESRISQILSEARSILKEHWQSKQIELWNFIS
jgi:RNA polymerase sigma factor (sigma-70 family)